MSTFTAHEASTSGDQFDSKNAPGKRRPRRGHGARPSVVVVVAGVVLLLIASSAALAPLLTSDGPNAVDPANRLLGPRPGHLFGTDNLGRDVFTRVVYGGRTTLLVGSLVVLFAVGGGSLLGLVTGLSRMMDMILMRIMDGLMSFPGLVLAIALLGVFGQGVATVVAALSIVYGPRVARIIRGHVLVIKEYPMVEAARSVGVGRGGILARHVLPYCFSPIVVQASFIFAYAVLGEAALDFLGVGVPATTPTWGNILTAAPTYLTTAWWIGVFPGIFIVLCVLSLNLLGDALRDSLDPKLRT